MLLSDVSIRGALEIGFLEITNLVDGAIGPDSIDLMLANDFIMFEQEYEYEYRKINTPIDPKVDNSEDGDDIHVDDDDYFLLASGDFALASTRERFTFSAGYAGQLEGKSSLARLGLLVHVTAGFFDAGFTGYPTLELVNLRRRPIKLYPGMPIAQMSIFKTLVPAELPYDQRGGSKYIDQGAKPARSQYHRNWPQS